MITRHTRHARLPPHDPLLIYRGASLPCQASR
ncbi:hypothetical protein E2C01_047505 [Portunus trituberculatus]|uniref:Uncharacterized protein n=1 Tax=Portunus trituberculatus TaxID=210409 RepID=A0A5B7GAN6_PORTR|nr:hypothetical protein [Portunus trituberculatus]